MLSCDRAPDKKDKAFYLAHEKRSRKKTQHRGKVLQTDLQTFFEDLCSDKQNKVKNEKDNDGRRDSAEDERINDNDDQDKLIP